MKGLTNDVGEDFRNPVEKIHADLAAQPGLTGALMKAADAMQKAFSEAADALRDVAWEVDIERRGRMSAPMRQDWAEVLATVDQLLRGDLLDDERRATLIEHVRTGHTEPAERQDGAA